MGQSYTKGCRDCGQQIRMAEINGKWGAYNPDGSGFHTCKQSPPTAVKQQQPLTVEERLARLEKKVFGNV